MALTLGIDFGTSTTELAVRNGGEPRLLLDPQGRAVFPSVVGFLPGGGALFGHAAKARRLSDPANTLHSVKRIIGLPARADAVREFEANHAFKLTDGGGRLPEFVTHAGMLTATQVVQCFLSHLRDLPAVRDVEISKTVLAVPSSYKPSQKGALLAAATGAGFRGVELIDEPYAAALPYLTKNRSQQERLVAVYDLGGGTFDFSVLKVQGATHWVLAQGGDPWLGGNDVDVRLAEHLSEVALQTHGWDLRADAQVRDRVLFAAEDLKVRLSQAPSVTLDLEEVDDAAPGGRVEVTRPRFESIVADLVQRTFISCDRVLADARIKSSAVDEVVLVGGSTRMPLVRAMVRSYFGREPQDGVPPDQAVALGAATAAALLAGERGVFAA